MAAREGGVSLEPPVGAAHGAAWRRRQRRLRSFGRFTVLSVKVAYVAQKVVQHVDAVERSYDGLEQTVGQHCLRVSALEGSFREFEELVVRSHDQLSSCVGEGARFSHELGLLQEALADRSSEVSVLQSSFGSALLDFESLASLLNLWCLSLVLVSLILR